MSTELFQNILPYELNFKVARKILPSKGNLVYEYNPFRNYRLTEKTFLYQGKYYNLEQLNSKHGIVELDNKWQEPTKGNQGEIIYDENGNIVYHEITGEVPEMIGEEGSVVDFITDELSFDLQHPVSMIPQYSYDDSVNLIINDGKNQPKLINSRFSAVGRNQYQIVDRKGNYDTNLYDRGEQFNSNTSLYKQIDQIPKLQFVGCFNGGVLPIGNYHFYFRYSDEDGNLSDFVAESGLVSVFIGNTPDSVRTGFRDENSQKLVRFILTNVDKSYQNVRVYYTKSTSDIDQNPTVSAFEIDQDFSVNSSGLCAITITGFENVNQITTTEINPMYQIYESVNAQASCQNMLFLANVNRVGIDYEDLKDASLYFLPQCELKDYDSGTDINYENNNLSKDNYTNSSYIYNYTGYWDQELYRLGVVYIMSDSSLSPVFNIRGSNNISSDTQYYQPDDIDYNKFENRNRIEIQDGFIVNRVSQFENAKGVIQLKSPDKPNQILSVNIKINKKVIQYLQQKYKIKGLFFVRQKRIPLTLCQALTIGINTESHTPVLPIKPDGSLVEESFNRSGYDKYKYHICINKETGEVVAGNTRIPIPLTALQKFGKAMSIIGGVALMAAGSFWVGASVIAVGTIIDNETGYAADVYGDDDDWEVYSGQVKPEDIEELYISERFFSDSREITHNFYDRLYFLKNNYVKVNAAICPEYDINRTHFNSIFNGDKVVIQESNIQPTYEYLSWDVNNERHFYNTPDSLISIADNKSYTTKILGVEDNTKLAAIDKLLFSARAGEAEEAFRYECLDEDLKINQVYNLVRGSFGPYVAFKTELRPNRIINIKIPGFDQNQMEDYFKIRFEDKTSFYAISDRIDLSKTQDWFDTSNDDYTLRKSLYRGDCYICQFTHRVNRNFQDPSSPINDKIVDPKCWRLNYNYQDSVLDLDGFEKINLGDVNAVQLGMWVTSTYRSSRNLNIRNIDDSIPNEMALTGNPRSYFPYTAMSAKGVFKVPEALCYNSGFEKSVSERLNFEVLDVPFIKNNFSTRIAYSDIQIKDQYKNGYRTFTGTHYRDYSIDYGSITKILEYNGELLCVFEHGVAIIPVNERAVAAEGQGGLAYINTSNVLPQNPKMLSNSYGSQWADSIIKSDIGYVYGVDTVAKKIWAVSPQGTFEVLSNFAVSEFLNNNISLTERELTPIIGIRNVKTHYNAFKKDIMFTFYDNTYGFEETVWNLCYNEFLQKFITFYSWVPSFSENIYNTYFSFDRNTSKWIAKLGQSKTGSDFAQGITLNNTIVTKNSDYIGDLSVSEDLLPKGSGINYNIKYSLEEDSLKNYEYFTIPSGTNELHFNNPNDYEKLLTKLYQLNEDGSIYYDETGRRKYLDNPVNDDKIVILLNIKADITIQIEDGHQDIKELEEYVSSYNDNYSNYNAGYLSCVVAVVLEDNKKLLTTDFWKHGQSGIFDIKDEIKPTHWYGKQHPFEFEFIVANDANSHKIFDNLEILSNNAEPESFHYEIVGDCYDFAKDKKNMYIRQEATKEFYQNLGSDITYDHKYSNLIAEQRALDNGFEKSTIFPLYYSRQDCINYIEDKYHNLEIPTKDFSNLAGAEIVYYKKLDEYRIWNHSKAVDITKYGRLRGNMQYKEDRWNVQINSLNMVQKNEAKWGTEDLLGRTNCKNIIPIEIKQSPVPEDIWNETTHINQAITKGRALVKWDNCQRKESKIKDKWIKIRIRYKGDKLAIITAIRTLYSISFS